MHSGVRGATELLQQEVGQAGRLTLPAPASLISATTGATSSVSVSSTNGMFVGELLAVDTGDNLETVAVTGLTSNSVSGLFLNDHAAGAPIMALGWFASGVVPPNMTDGSTGTVLKIYGDINADNNMVYVEYTCDTTAHLLYRNSMAWNAASKSAVTPDQVLLTNIMANRGGTACFTYQTATVGTTTYVTDVAITLTVQTQQADPVTKQFQTETKALLNVSPRNVFNTWMMAGLGEMQRVQSTPPSITTLLQQP